MPFLYGVSFFIIGRMRQHRKTDTQIFEIFLLLNPYLLLLHVSGLRDDLIVSVVLFLAGTCLTFVDRFSFKDLLFYIVALIILFGLRPGAGLICAVGTFYLILYRRFGFLSSTGLSLAFSIFVAFIFWSYIPLSSISAQFAFVNFYNLFFRPLSETF